MNGRTLAKTAAANVVGATTRAVVRRHWATVLSVQTGPPKTLTLKLDGSAVAIAGYRYHLAYATPTAGDYVLVDQVGTDFVVIGPLA